LRSAANGRYLGYNWGPFVTRDAQPNGWYVQQQFKLEERPDGTYAIRYAGYETREPWFPANRYLTVDSDGRLALGAATAETAARFAKEVVRGGTRSAVAAATGADVAVVVVGSMPAINGRENDDRVSTALAPSQAALVKAVRAANPNTVVVLENSYPTTVDSATDIRRTATLKVKGETIPPRDLRGPVAAWTFDEYAGTTLVDTTRTAGTAVAATAAGQWVGYSDVDLRGGPCRAALRVSADAPATVEVRLDHPTRGRPLGTVTVPATGGRYAWTDVSAALRRVGGRHDVYLVFTAPVRLDTVRLS
jgi:hypothetical protein